MTSKIEDIKKVYFVGIKGVGMAALARFVLDMGKVVLGSDPAVDSITNSVLDDVSINIHDSFDVSNIDPSITMVVYTGAHGGDKNVEVQRSLGIGLIVMNYGQALAYFLGQKKIIAVAGTHGKTTTTAMLATVLKDAGLDPSWIVGTGKISTLGSSGHYGKGEFAVVEADEYLDQPNGKPKFLHLNPYALIITSLDWDHPDVYKTHKSFLNAFHKLLKRVKPKGLLVLVGNNSYLRKLTKTSKLKIRWILPRNIWHNLKLSIPGEFNRIDATYAATMAHELGVSQANILKSLYGFKGVERRLEFKGEKDGWLVVDDYAHHPTEVKMALSAVKERYPDAWITVAFQSHTFSRTEAYAKDFAKSFSLANEILIAPTFSSARETKPKIVTDLYELMKPTCNVLKIGSSIDLLNYMLNQQVDNKSKVLITMGAGDIYQWIK